MKSRNVRSKKRYLYAFLIGTVIFLFGFAISYSVAYMEYQRVTGLQDPLSYKIFQDKLQYSLFNKDLCSEESYMQISKDLAFQGSLMAAVEERLGKDSKDVVLRKKLYSLILLEHLELVKIQNEQCGKNINIILFFYSNKKEDVEKSEDLGKILGVLSEKNQDNLIIYSFDVNLESEIIKSLKEKYSITQPYTIIVNENQTFNHIDNIDEIQLLLLN